MNKPSTSGTFSFIIFNMHFEGMELLAAHDRAPIYTVIRVIFSFYSKETNSKLNSYL